MRRMALASLAALTFSQPAISQDDPVEALFDALRLDEVVEIMRDEGVDAAEGLEGDLFPDRGGEAWGQVVRAIHDPDRMKQEVASTFMASVDAATASELLGFFESEAGAAFVAFEIEARRALYDADVEAAATVAAAEAPAERRAQIDAFIEVNDLVEQNVSGALNSNYAFFRGLADGNGALTGLSEDQIIADVYASEPEVRQSTIDWLQAFLTMAYTSMPDEDLEAYIELSRSEAGKALNVALFDAFDDLYDSISYELGLSAAKFMQAQDI